jgi:signal transduction histidine kinase
MIELKISNNPIRKTIYDAVESIKSKAIEKGINIIADIDGEYYIFHDYRWTKEAFVNVLENAVKYSFEKGTIKVRIVPMNSYIRVDIEDNGIGIPKKDFNNVFKRFFRGDSEAVKAAEGSGVGLYLARKILENEGGSIIVDSEVNKGTTFSIFLRR